MKCERCKKENKNLYTYTYKGEPHILCGECIDVVRHAGFDADLSLKTDDKCPACGTRLAAIRRSGYLGCASCLDYFKGQLMHVVDKMQNHVIFQEEKRITEIKAILLENEFYAITEKEELTAADEARLEEIKKQLAALEIKVRQCP